MVLLEYVAVPLLILLLAQLTRLRTYKLFPWFFGYICYGIATGIVRFAIHNHSHTYFIVYWVTAAGFDILEVAVLYEVYCAVFRGLAHTWWFRLIFPLTFLTAVTLTVAHALLVPVPTSNRLFAITITLDLGAELLEGLTFVVLVACVAILGLRWRQYAFGITAGFGFYGTIALADTTKFSVFVTSSRIIWGAILIGAYSGAVLIWLWFFRKPQKPEPLGASDEFLLRAKQELEQYRRLLRRMRGL